MSRRKTSYNTSPSIARLICSGLIKGTLLVGIIWSAFWAGAHFSTHQQLICDISNNKKDIALLQAMSTSTNQNSAFAELLKRKQNQNNQLQTSFNQANNITAYALSPIEGVKRLQQTCPK